MKEIILSFIVFFACLFSIRAQILLGMTKDGSNGIRGNIIKFTPATNNLTVVKLFENYATSREGVIPFAPKAVFPAIPGLHLHPNPANQNTMITFYLGTPGRNSSYVFNIAGQQIGIIEGRVLNSGNQTIPWNTEMLAGGVFYSLKNGKLHNGKESSCYSLVTHFFLLTK